MSKFSNSNNKDKAEQIVEKMRCIYPDQATNIIKAISQEKPTTFRINNLANQFTGFTDSTIAFSKGPLEESYILKNETKSNLIESKEYKEGAIYLQELSSQIPVLVLDPKPNEKILDLCGAPGSKTTQIASILKNNSAEIIAVEKNKPRFFLLKHNLNMQKAQDKVTTFLNDGINFYKKYPKYLEYFDKVLVDAPCSNEGSINLTKPQTYKFWNPHKFKEASRIQKGLIIAGYRMLKRGGTLVYSTCTYSVEENEEVVNWLLAKALDLKVEDIVLPINNLQKGFTSWRGKNYDPQIRKTVRVVPNNLFTAFYIACLKKA